jgi:hypothetical protein
VFVRSSSWTARARLCQPRRCEVSDGLERGRPLRVAPLDGAADRADGRINPCDLYAFPAVPGTTALIVTVNPDAGRSSPTTFRPDALYEFVVASSGSTSGDIAFRVTFTGPDDSGRQQVRSSTPTAPPAALEGFTAHPATCSTRTRSARFMATPPGFARPFTDAVVADLW